MKQWFNGLGNEFTLPNTTQYVLDQLMHDADNDPNCTGYRQFGGPTSSEDLKSIMTETYSFFPTHYFKVTKTLVNIEKNLQTETFYTNCINIIDIGCNIGTATYAYIDILTQYITDKNITDMFKINIVFVECSTTRVSLLRKCIKWYIAKLSEIVGNITITYTICNTQFPQNIDMIKKNLLTNCHCLVIMSNVVNWMGEEADIAKGIHQINLEIDFYDSMKVLHIENISMKDKINAVFNHLNTYGIYDLYGLYLDNRLVFHNPTNSYYRDIDGRYRYTHKGYYYGKVQPTELINALVNDSLLLQAFEKAFFYQEMDMITDNIELRYFRNNYSKVISNIKEQIKNGYSYTNNFLEYHMPKSNGKKRPLFIDFFSDELFSIALLLTLGIKIDVTQDDEISYGNRLLNDRENPSVMKNYYKQYFQNI